MAKIHEMSQALALLRAPKVLEIRKDGDLFIGDLIWSDGTTWPAWQMFKRLYKLKANARAAGFEGPIVCVWG